MRQKLQYWISILNTAAIFLQNIDKTTSKTVHALKKNTKSVANEGEHFDEMMKIGPCHVSIIVFYSLCQSQLNLQYLNLNKIVILMRDS